MRLDQPSFVAVALLGCIWTTLPARAADPAVQVVSLQINKKLEKPLENLVMNGFPGVSMSMIVSLPEGKRAIGIDEKASKLTAFTDDQKTDLTQPDAQDKGYHADWLSAFSSKISDDGQYVAIPVRSAGKVPAAGAREIILNASVCILCGAEEKTAEQANVALKEGTKLTVGPIPFTIGKVEDGKFGDTKLNVPLKASKPVDAIKSIEFIDASGKAIDAHVVSRSSMNFGAMSSNETTYGLKAKADVVTVKVTYYEKVEKVNVPVDLKVGVGLP